MKKIIIIALTIFALTSCGQNWMNNNAETWISQVELDSINIVQEKEKDWDIIEEKITVWKIEKSLFKLNGVDVSNDDLQMLDENINYIYNNSITNKALENNDITLCSKLEENNQYSCKKSIIVKWWNIEKCYELTNTWSINSCKNEIFYKKADSDLDESICEKIIDESEEKFEINSCKNRILTEKARVSLDKNICKKIDNMNDRSMCLEIIQMEK